MVFFPSSYLVLCLFFRTFKNEFDKAILLIRNPLDATISTFNDLLTGKINNAYASMHEFEKYNYH